MIVFTDKRPLISDLSHFAGRTRVINIAEEIGFNYRAVGDYLLGGDDKDSPVPSIEEEYYHDPSIISLEILIRWVLGRGIEDRSWKKLLEVLKKAECKALAMDIEEVITDN